MTRVARDEAGPFEVVLLGLMFVSRIFQLFPGNRNGIPEQILGDTFFMAWSVIMLMGPPIAYLGIFWGGRKAVSLLLEQFGLIFVSGGSAIYLITLANSEVSVPGGFTTHFFLAGYGIASLWRILQIHRSMRELTHANGDEN